MIIDKRVAKTRARIMDALMILSLEQEVSRISVSALTQKAEVNRSTFYLHYADVAEILEDIEKDISYKISVHFKKFDFKDIYNSTCAMFEGLTLALNENKIVKKYILESTSSQYVIGRLKEMFADNIADAVVAYYPQKQREKLIYPLTFVAAGIIDTYIKWAHSKQSVPLNELIKTVSALTEKAIDLITI